MCVWGGGQKKENEQAHIAATSSGSFVHLRLPDPPSRPPPSRMCLLANLRLPSLAAALL